MKLATFLLFATLPLLSHSQCPTGTTTKILILGDSWAYFSWDFDSYNENLDNYGLSDYEAYSTTNLSVNGAVASTYFDDAGRTQEIETYINSNPDLEYVHLSLGGNDVMDVWDKNMSAAETNEILDTLMVDLKNGIDFIHSINPDLKIIISGYDYANFGETVGALPPSTQPFHPYYPLWNGMDKPNFTEINTLLFDASTRFEDSSWVWPNVHFINNLGLMQWYFGQETPLSVPPSGTYPVNSAPVPGGIIDYPSPQEAMNFSGQDAFHLSDQGFEVFVGRHFSEFYWWQIRSPHQTLFASDSSKNGTVTVSNFWNSEIGVGNDQPEKQIGIIHFNTSILDDTYPIQSASLFIRRDSSFGSSLHTESLQFETKSGFFGGTDALQLDDFLASADDSTSACTYGSIDTVGTYLRIDLPASALPFIDVNGTTQFRISYDISDTTRFAQFLNDGDEILLDVKYSTNPFASVNEGQTINYSLFPNPVANILNISGIESGEKVQLYDLQGRLMMETIYESQGINVSHLPQGIYLIQLPNLMNSNSMKMIKM